jgi:hypothetical protein
VKIYEPWQVFLYIHQVPQVMRVLSLGKIVQMQGQQTVEHDQATHDRHQVLECTVGSWNGGYTAWSEIHGMPILPGSPEMKEALRLALM